MESVKKYLLEMYSRIINSKQYGSAEGVIL